MIADVARTSQGLPPGSQFFVNQQSASAVAAFHQQFESSQGRPEMRLASHDLHATLKKPERIVLLCRHPMDALLSYYHYSTRHRSSFGGDLDAFLRSTGLGVFRLSRWYNAWGVKRCSSLVLTYEQLRDTPAKQLGRSLRKLDIQHDAKLVQVAKRWDFERRQQRERESAINSSDTNSLFVRAGRIGEGAEVMNADQRMYVVNTMSALLDEHGRKLLESLEYPEFG